MADEKIFGERLTDEQLENVAGGSTEEKFNDMFFLKEIGFNIPGGKYSYVDVDRAWAQVGITVIDNFRKNEYYYEGKSIPRDEAMKVAMEKVGKKVDIRPYLKV